MENWPRKLIKIITTVNGFQATYEENGIIKTALLNSDLIRFGTRFKNKLETMPETLTRDQVINLINKTTGEDLWQQKKQIK